MLQFSCSLVAVLVCVLLFSGHNNGIHGADSATYPMEQPRCVVGDLACIVKVINHYVERSAKGIPELNISPIDPLSVPKLDIIQSEDSPVNVKLNLRNVDFVGFSRMRIKEAIGFAKDPKTSPFEFRGIIPQLTVLSDYKVTGNVLVLPIVGNGRLNMTFDNMEFSLKLDKKVVQRKGKTYLDVKRSYLHFNTTRTYIAMENLFNGDKLLSDSTNRFLNENWSDVINEMKPEIENSTGIVTGNVIKAVFDKFPYEEFWLPTPKA